MARYSPLWSPAPPQPYSRSHGGTMEFRWKSRRAPLFALGLAVLLAACDRVEAESGGDVEYNWDPSRSETVAGVPAAAITSALQTRLAGEPPADVAPDLWKHVEVL